MHRCITRLKTRTGSKLILPADFIVEYVAQTRGWFYTMMALHAGVFHDHPTLSKTPPFKNCICHGVVLDDKGQKLSKRLNNYADPKDIFTQFGADALRWFMIASPVMRGSELYIDKEGKFIRDVVRLAIKPIWNAYNFFCLYANADGVRARYKTQSSDLMDRYILSKCRHAVETIAKALDAYDTPSATEAVTQFFELLNNWYIRRSKERFWKELVDADKQSAYDTLYTVMHIMARAAAPLLPLTLERIYTALTDESSVHLADYPDVSDIAEESLLMREMDFVRDVCNAALSVRSKQNIRVRQPLKEVRIVAGWERLAQLLAPFEPIIQDEINAKQITYNDSKDDLITYSDFKLQIHFPVLGKRLPDKIKQIIPASKKGDWKPLPDGRIKIAGEILGADEFTLQLEPKPDLKGRAQALSTNDALVILDTEVTDELRNEGYARDLVRLIQQARKDAGLRVTDRIHLRLRVAESLKPMLEMHRGYIAEQVLAASLTEGDMRPCGFITNEMIEHEEVSIGFSTKVEAA